MGLIDFLEGAYKGGRLLFLLYDHDKQVKLRYKAIKGNGIKRLPNPSGVIVSESINRAQKQALLNQQYSQYMRGLGDISSLARTVNNISKPYYELPRKSPLPSSGITPHCDDIIGDTFGFIGSLTASACESLIKGANARKRQELTQNLNRYEQRTNSNAASD